MRATGTVLSTHRRSRRGWVKKIRRNSGLEVGIRQGIALNNRLGKFKDRRVREALTLAVDFEWQNRVLHFGYQKRAHSYWPDTILTASGLPSADELALLSPYREQLPAELFEQSFRFPEIVTKEDYRANILRARELMNEAGWHIVDGVLRNSAGKVFEIEFLVRSSGDARTLLPYFQRLKTAGNSWHHSAGIRGQRMDQSNSRVQLRCLIDKHAYSNAATHRIERQVSF